MNFLQLRQITLSSFLIFISLFVNAQTIQMTVLDATVKDKVVSGAEVIIQKNEQKVP